MAEELETILRLVAEGHLSPEEAAPIIEALTARRRVDPRDPDDEGVTDDHLGGPLGRDRRLDRLGERINRRVSRRVARSLDRAFDQASAAVASATAGADALGGGRHLRIRITERGRQVVNLRIPVGFAESALRFVPGLGGDQSQRIRDAVRAGAVGPILDVEDPDGEGGVLISVE